MTRATVDCGACGFQAAIETERAGRDTVRIRISSDCEAVQRWAPSIATVDWRELLGAGAGTGDFWQSAFRQLTHRGCPIPMAVLKTIEVEIGAALPVDVHLRFHASEGPMRAEGTPDD